MLYRFQYPGERGTGVSAVSFKDEGQPFTLCKLMRCGLISVYSSVTIRAVSFIIIYNMRFNESSVLIITYDAIQKPNLFKLSGAAKAFYFSGRILIRR
jgi:hypothetical protein